MKTLACKMCGSTQLIEENGMYLCQSCGTKYSASELDDSNKTDETPSPKMLKKEVEKQEEIKRLRALVKDDYSLWFRILELDYGDWEAYYYCHCNSALFDKNGNATRAIIGGLGDDFSRVFEKLKDRASSDSEVKMCIKEVIYRDFKKWATGRLNLDSDYPHFDDIKDVQEFMQMFCNRFIVAFGDDYSDFLNELMKDFDFDKLKEKVEKAREKAEKARERAKSKKKTEDIMAHIPLIISTIIVIITIIVLMIST